MSLNANHSEEAIKSNDEANENQQTEVITKILQSQTRCAEIGCVNRMEAIKLLSRDEVKKMKSDYIYGVTRHVENSCDVTASRAYQVYWANNHSDTSEIFLALVAPVYEHDFEVLKFPDDEEDEKDEEMNKCVQKTDGEWSIVDYRGRSTSTAKYLSVIEPSIVLTLKSCWWRQQVVM